MRAFLTATVLLLLCSSFIGPGSGEKTFYYCWSKPITWTEQGRAQQGKYTVLYTDVSEVEKQNVDITSKKWAVFVKQQCANAGGCGSDFNYCLSAAAGILQRDSILNRYRDTSKYIIKKIPFSAWNF